MKNSWLLGCVLLITSCQIEVELPLGEIKGEVPVIEGIWTNNPNLNEVNVTLAKNYLDQDSYTIIKDSKVSIRAKSTGLVIPFKYSEAAKSYRPLNSDILAIVGETYELIVEWKDNVFFAEGLMLEPPILDSLTYQYEEERPFRDEGYYIKAYGKVPFKENNYYRIQIIENDTLKNDPQDYLLFDDTFGLSFFERGFELGYAFDLNDRVRIILYRMTREPYNYLNQLLGLLFSDGGLFSPPPQNPDTNIKLISGKSPVLGYFLVSPIISELVIIKEK